MADKDIKINIKLNTGNAEESVKGIKTALRDAKNEALKFEEGSTGFTKAAERAGQLQDKLGDMNATIANLSGNSVQNLTSAFSKVATAGLGAFGAIQGAQALFGDENKDLQKTLVKMQAVMSLSNGIKEFADIGQSAKDFKGVIASLIPGLFAQTTATEGAAVATGTLNATMAANPIMLVVIALAALVAGIAYFISSSESAAEKQAALNELLKKHSELVEKEIESVKKLRAINDSAYQFDIDLAKAQGKSKAEILALEKKAIEDKIADLGYVNGKRGKLNAEELQQQTAFYREIRLLEATFNKDLADNKVKSAEEANAKYLTNEQKRIKTSGEAMLAEQKLREDNEAINEANLLAKYAAEEEAEAARIKKSGEAMVAEQKAKDDANDAQIAADEELGKDDIAIAQSVEDAKYQIAQGGVSAIGGLSDLLFSIKNANLKKGSAEEEKAARTQFKINKAVSIASTIISTIQGVQNALVPKPNDITPEPFATIRRIATAIGVGIAGATNVAQIAATQFQGAGGAGGAGGAVPSAGAGGAGGGEGEAPAFNPQTFGINSGASGVNNNINGGGNGNNQMRQRVYVVQTDIANTNNQVEVLETRARF